MDGSITKSPCGGEVAGRSPVDRGKQGTKRSVACDGDGIPLHLVAARANDHDSPLLEPTLAGIYDMIGPLPQGRHSFFPTVHLDRGYDSGKTRDLLEILGFDGEIAVKGVPAPIQVGQSLAGRTHTFVDERLRQAAPVHRQTQGHRRVLPLPRRCVDCDPSLDQSRPQALPLANQAHHPSTPLTIICRSL